VYNLRQITAGTQAYRPPKRQLLTKPVAASR